MMRLASHDTFHGAALESADPLVVAAGFGRYEPGTEVEALLQGAWLFLPVHGGLRVALDRRRVKVAHAQIAAAIASSPGSYSYVLQGDTYVPSRLNPGDRHAVATTG
jgi:hypothetical protein